MKNRALKVKAPAKINAFLDVTGRREDGYHELKTIFVPVTLYDIVEITLVSEGIRVRCSNETAPSDESNLAAKASRLFFEKTGVVSGAEIFIEKNIPVAAGLGGGSSDAASTLKALNALFENILGEEELCSLALKIGADVPFFIKAVPAYAEGIGEKLYPVPDLVSYEILLVNPVIPLSTAEVYKKLNLGLTKCKKENKYPALNQGPCDIKDYLRNDLEAPAISLCPTIREIRQYLTGLAAEGILMSGSGPSVFGLFTDKKKAEAASISIKENTRWWACRVEMIHSPDGNAA